MSEGRLTREEAIEATHMRWLGTKVREICAKFDVDPRRLYEVWGGERFSGLMGVEGEAYRRFAVLYPDEAKGVDPSLHIETRTVTKRTVEEEKQKELF
ncbi:MAG: hypothetical protein MI753_14845 [Hyphomicrobiales bacterium]|nr:hypothetical protein [Hyphomicrobiales bacterium]